MSLPNCCSLSAFLTATVLAASASAQMNCGPSWTPGFFTGDLPGYVGAQAAYDDGTGPVLVVGGDGGVGVQRLTQNGWQPLPSPGIGTIRSLLEFNDGSGNKLYAAGDYGVARWNGNQWSALGALNGSVSALAVVTVGGASSLYATGGFTANGVQPLYHIAKWTSTTWAQLGPGLSSGPSALIGFDDGSGPALYVGGYSMTPAFDPSNNLGTVARWNGSTWTSVGNLVNYQIQPVLSLQAFDDGTGTALYAGGLGSGGTVVLKWYSGSWVGVGSAFSPASYGSAVAIVSMVPHSVGGSAALFVAGNFASAGGVVAPNVARWTASGWQAVAGSESLSYGVASLLEFDNGDGPSLWSTSYFGPKRWDGSQWRAPGQGLLGEVRAITAGDLGSGPQIIVGGLMSLWTSSGINGVVAYGNDGWTPLGLSASYVGVQALARGGPPGSALYAAGQIGIAVNGVWQWDGVGWSLIGDAQGGVPRALQTSDLPTGPILYVGGSMSSINGVAMTGVASWDGAYWTNVGGSGFNGEIRTMALYDDGTGLALYVGGDFTYAGGVPANGIARWNGAVWEPIGIGVGGGQPFVRALAVYDSIGGPALYAGGMFTSAGGIPVQGIARLTGSIWSNVGSADGAVHALNVFDVGDGPKLYAGGDFSMIAGISSPAVACWDGGSWSALGVGTPGSVRALGGVVDGSGAALWVGGQFGTAGGIPSSRIARYAGPAPHLQAPPTFAVGAPLVFDIQSQTATTPYVLDFSLNGSSPGFDVGTVHIPLNPPLVGLTFGTFFPTAFVNFWGYTDSVGKAQAHINLPNQAQLAGLTLSSSFAMLDFSAPSGIGGVACPRTTTLLPPKPQIQLLSRATAPTVGWPSLTITGTGFMSGATVRVGAGYATGLVITPTQITCAVPPGNVGPVTVRVDNPNGTSGKLDGAFSYVETLTIASATPLVAAPGTTITIAGAGFQTGATVAIGGVNAPVTNLSPTQIQCTWPAGVPCGTTLLIANPDGQAASGPFNPAPGIAFLIPGSGPAAGGTPLFILGTNFLPSTTVTIGGAPAAVQSQTLNSILVTTPPGSPGPAPLVITSASGCTASATYVYN